MLKAIPNVGNVTHSCWFHSKLYVAVMVLEPAIHGRPGRIPKSTCPWSNWSMAPGGDLKVMKSDMGMSCLGMTWNNPQYAM